MNLKPIFEKLYPEGSFGGQCGAFAHKLVMANKKFPSLPVLLGDKKIELRKSGYLATPYIGDVVLLANKPFGHIAIINDVIGSKFQLTESNYSYTFRVSHKRLINVDDPMILGYWRGDALYFPLKVIKICLVQNGAPWMSMGSKFEEIRQRIIVASQKRLDVHIDVSYVNFNPPFVDYGNSQRGIYQKWLDDNLLKYSSGYDIICYLLPSSQIPPHGVVFGWGDGDGKSPFITQVFADENESISGNFGTMNLFINSFIHENFGHVLKVMDGGPDVTHQYLNNVSNPSTFDLKGLMDTYNYNKL